MEYQHFYNYCKKFGDQSLPEKERWKSIRHVHCIGQATPQFDFQEDLKHDRLFYTNNGSPLGPGFVIIQNPINDFNPNHDGDSNVVTFMPIESICAITFVPIDGVTNASTLRRYALGEDVDIPVLVRFEYSTYFFSKEDTINVPILFSEILTDNEYDVIFKDYLGNEVDNPSLKVGEYRMIVECKNGYIGHGETTIVIKK